MNCIKHTLTYASYPIGDDDILLFIKGSKIFSLN